MLNFFKKIFLHNKITEEKCKDLLQKEENIIRIDNNIKQERNMQQPSQTNINQEFIKQAAVMKSLNQQNNEKNKGRRAEIRLFEFDWGEQDPSAPGAKPILRPVNGGRGGYHPIIVTFKTPADIYELKRQYAQCEQTFEIIRWLDPIPDESNAIQENTNSSNKESTNSSNNEVQKNSENANIQQNNENTSLNAISSQKSKPKFYKIGNIEIKNDNGKIYQRQWIKLSETEAQNFRLINDKTNSIVNLKGKSIEMKKWILIEKTDDEIQTMEESLNG